MYIDDLCAINDNNCKDIKVSGLDLQEEKSLTSKASFFDLLNTIKNKKKLKTQLFDKRDPFPFSKVYMLHLDNNILSSIYHASIGSEILRFVRPSSDSKTFIKLSNQL